MSLSVYKRLKGAIFYEQLHSLWHRFLQLCARNRDLQYASRAWPCLYCTHFYCCCHSGIFLIWENVIGVQKSENTEEYSSMVTVVWLTQQHIDTHLVFHIFKRTNVFFLKVISSSIINVSKVWWENSLETKEHLVI